MFAKAIATIILGLRDIMPVSHAPSGIDFRPSRFNRDIAPIINSMRISACPAFEMRPEALFAVRGELARDKTEPGGEITTALEALHRWGDRLGSQRNQGANAGDGL